MKLILLALNLLLVAADKRHVGKLIVCSWLTLLRGLIVLLISFFFLCSEFQPRSSYYYDYSSRTISGIPQLANQYAGYELNSEVIFYATDANNVVMKMFDVEIGEIHRTTSEPPEQAEIKDYKKSQIERELSKPIKFKYQNGRVEDFEADSNEPNWSLNIKKSVLSLFNLDLNPEKIIKSEDGSGSRSHTSDNSDNDYYGVYEDGVNGVCETVYEIRHSADSRANERANDRDYAKNVINVTKVRNYENCLSQATIINDNIESKGCPRLCRKNKDSESVFGYYPVPDEVENYYDSECPHGYEPFATPTDQYTNYRYNISRRRSSSWTIDCALSEGKVVVNADGNKIVALTKQNATLTRIVDNDKAPGQPQSGKKHSSLIFGLDTSRDTDIPYSNLLTTNDQNQLKTIANQIIDSITQAITFGKVADSKNVPFETVQLLDVLAAMNPETLKSFFKEKAEKGKSDGASDQDKIKRQLVIDAVATSGSKGAAETIRDLIINFDLDKREAKRALQTLPANMMTPSRDTLDSYQQMFENNRLADAESHGGSRKGYSSLFSTLALTLAKMVKKACFHNILEISDVYAHFESSRNSQNSPALTIMAKADPRKDRGHSYNESNYFERNTHNKSCKSSDYGKYVKWFAVRFEKADNLQEKLDAAKALAHLGSKQILEIFEPYVSGKVDKDKCPGYKTKDESRRVENCIFVRTEVVNSLHHLTKHYPKQVKAMVLPLYKDRSEPEEVRMAAFSVFIQTVPKPHELISIVSELRSENNRHVQSFTRSVIENAANFTEPCHQPLARAAREALIFLPDYQEDDANVNTKSAEFYDDDTKNGASFYYRTEKTSDSSVPSSGVLEVKKLFGKMKDNVLTVTFHQQGLDKYFDRPGGLERLATDYVTSIFNNRSRSRARRATGQDRRDENNQDVSELKKQLKVETRKSANPKLRLYTKAFEKSRYYAFDEQDLRDYFDSLRDELSQTVREMSKGKSGYYARLYMPISYTQITVTDNGLPVLTRAMKPVILAVKVDDAKLSVSNSKSSQKAPSEVEIVAKIEPQVLKDEMIYLCAANEENNHIYGAGLSRNYHFKAPFEVEAKYNEEDNSVKLKLRPQTNQEVLRYISEPMTFIAKDKHSLGKKSYDGFDERTIKTMSTPFKIEKEVGVNTFGLGFKIKGKTEDERYDRKIWESKDGKTKSKVEAIVEEMLNKDPRQKDFTVTLQEDKTAPASGYDVTVRFNKVYNQEKIKISKNSSSGKTRAANLDKEQGRKFYPFNANEQCNGNPGRHYPNVAKEVANSANDEDLKKHARKLLENTKDSWSWTYQTDKYKDEINLATRTCNLAISAESIGSKPVKMAANVMNVQSIDKRVNVMKAEVSVKQPQESKNRKSSFYWITSSVTYPPGPNEFNVQTTSPQDLTTTYEASLGEGERCAQNKGITVSGVLERVKDEVYNQDSSKSNNDHDSWYANQCQEDQKQGREGSYACEKAAKDYAKLNKLRLVFDYDDMSPRLTNLTKKLDLALKSKYYHRMSYNGADVNNSDNKVRLEAEYSEKGKGRPVVNLKIEKPREEILFKRIDAPISEAPSTLESYRTKMDTNDENCKIN